MAFSPRTGFQAVRDLGLNTGVGDRRAGGGLGQTVDRLLRAGQASRPAVGGGSSSDPGVVTSAPIALTDFGGGQWGAEWQVPGLDGRVAAYGMRVELGGASEGLMIGVIAGGSGAIAYEPRLVHDGWSAGQITYVTSSVSHVGAVVSPGSGMTGGTAYFSVVAW